MTIKEMLAINAKYALVFIEATIKDGEVSYSFLDDVPLYLNPAVLADSILEWVKGDGNHVITALIEMSYDFEYWHEFDVLEVEVEESSGLLDTNTKRPNCNEDAIFANFNALPAEKKQEIAKALVQRIGLHLP